MTDEMIYEKTIARLARHHISSPRLEARLLISSVLCKEEDCACFSYKLTAQQQKLLEERLQKRITGMPLDKILGHREFYKYDFITSEDVLSPRPETEILCEAACGVIRSKQPCKILDLGTGSGCILISLIKENTKADGIGVDISQKALAVAQKNAANLSVQERIKWLNKSWYDIDFTSSFEHKFDIIVSNPPYIKTKEIETLDIAVKKYDPVIALDGGEDGLKAYRQIACVAHELLKKDGHIILEIGLGQTDAVIQIFEQQHLRHIKTIKDFSGIDRVLIFDRT